MGEYEFYVEVVSNDGEVVKRLGPMSERRAEKVERGLEINLNHDAFVTRVVEAEREEVN